MAEIRHFSEQVVPPAGGQQAAHFNDLRWLPPYFWGNFTFATPIDLANLSRPALRDSGSRSQEPRREPARAEGRQNGAAKQQSPETPLNGGL